MKGWLTVPLFLALCFTLSEVSDAATYCGAARFHCCKASCCPAPSCGCPVKKVCQQTVYEERQFTTYETTYVEVPAPVQIEVINYVPETEMRDMPFTTWETRPKPCAPVDCCGPESCCCEKVPVTCLRPVPVTVFRPVPGKQTLPRTRIEARTVAKTFTCKVPRVVCVECPVEVSCPMPGCCSAPNAGY